MYTIARRWLHSYARLICTMHTKHSVWVPSNITECNIELAYVRYQTVQTATLFFTALTLLLDSRKLHRWLAKSFGDTVLTASII